MELADLIRIAYLHGLVGQLKVHARALAQSQIFVQSLAALQRGPAYAYLLIYAVEVAPDPNFTSPSGWEWEDNSLYSEGQTRYDTTADPGGFGVTAHYTSLNGLIFPVLKVYGPGDPDPPNIRLRTGAGPAGEAANYTVRGALFDAAQWRGFVTFLGRATFGVSVEHKLDELLDELRCARERLDVLAAAGAQETRVVVR